MNYEESKHDFLSLFWILTLVLVAVGLIHSIWMNYPCEATVVDGVTGKVYDSVTLSRAAVKGCGLGYPAPLRFKYKGVFVTLNSSYTVTEVTKD